jgi:PAS domain S-box-containing protein
MAFDWDAVTGITQRSDNAADVLGSDRGSLASSLPNIFLSQMHPDDRTRLKQCIRALRPGMPSYALTFRYVQPDGRLVWLEEAGKGEFDATGKLLRVKGLTRDITDRRQAEDALAERNAQLALAGRAGRVGSYAYDVNKGVMQISEGYAAIHGLSAGTTETTLCEWRSRVHPDDLRRVEVFRDQVFANRQKESNIEYRIVRSDGEMRWVERRSSVSYDGEGRPTRVAGVSIDVTERKGAEERQRVLVAELDHRVKNALATVSSIVSHTGVGNRSVTDFVAALEGRVRSMAATHELLGAGCWRGVSLKQLVRRELAPYAARNNTRVSGPEVVLRAEAGQAMAMVLHELATNAAKYGALSTKEGRVSIRWDQRVNGCGLPPRLVLEWRESAGPPVIAPKNPGYGTTTIRDLIPYEFGGTVDLVFAPEGIRCRVELPAAWLSSGGELVSDAPDGAPVYGRQSDDSDDE